MAAFFKDLRHACRLLLRSPGFTVVALASLTLGIGANTAIFSLVNAVLLRPMPVSAPEELVSIFQADDVNPGNLPMSHLNFKDLRAGNTTFVDLAGVSFGQVNVQPASGEARQEAAQIVSGNYFDLIGVRMRLGRGFTANEDAPPNGEHVAVISWAYWQEHFGGDERAVGSTVVINRAPFTVIGITPRNFTGTFALGTPSFWLTMATHALTQPALPWYEQRRGLFLFPFGRLKPGVTIEQGQANLATIMASLSKQYPADNARRGHVRTRPLVEARIDPNGQGQLTRLSQLLMTVVGIVLAIACANLANLLLARASKRRRELAVRLAIGADRWRLIRQLLTESLLLAFLGGAMGLMLASWLVRVIAATPDLLPLPLGDTGPALDPTVLTFTMLLSLVTGVVFGLAPALQASRTDVIGAIKQEAMPAGEGRGWLRKGLVAAQVALSIVSLVGAGWFVRSLSATVNIAPGFATETVAIATVNLGREGYDRDRGLTFYEQAIERARAIPGAVSAAFAENVPLAGVQINRSMYLETEDTTARDLRLIPVNYVSPGYFETTSIPLVSGRDFDRRDSMNAPSVAIINETMAKRFWPDRSPIGQRFRFFGEDTSTEVVGVAHDSKVNGLAEDDAPLIYEPLYQDYRSFGSLLVRFSQPPSSAGASLRGVIASLDSGLSVLDVRTLDQQVEASLTGQRSLTGLIGLFGTIALLLAASGIYGVASFWVGLRTREIGVRMALGARPAGMLALVLRQSMAVVLVGLLIGLALTGFVAIFLGSQVSTLLVGVSPTDPGTFVATVLVLFLVALLACAWPARRASRIDPLIALRQD